MKNKNKLIAFLIINIIISILETIAFVLVIQRRSNEWFRYYTQLSNLFLLACSLMNICFTARTIKTGKNFPRILSLLSYMATCTTTVTLIIVLFVLSWMVGDLWWLLTYDSMLYMHTLCPILAIITLKIFIPEHQTKKSALIALVPTIIYAIVGIVMNILRIWDGPYPFLQVYNQPIWASFGWAIVILGVAYLIARLLLLPTRADRSRS